MWNYLPSDLQYTTSPVQYEQMYTEVALVFDYNGCLQVFVSKIFFVKIIVVIVLGTTIDVW